MIPALLPVYNRLDVLFERGEGARLYAKDGRTFLDFGSGVAVNALGHCHPHLVKALQEQAGKLWHCSNLYRVEGQEIVAQKLVDHSFADLVFFCNSGAEALEGAIKTMRRFHYAAGNPEKNRVIAAHQAFHGRSLATIAAGGQEKHMAGFAPHMPGFDHVPFGDAAAVEAAITPETAGILVEPVQGEGGLATPPDGYLRALRQIADKHGILLALDEVQTGNGRTGKFYAYQWEGIEPDILATAKGLGGGFPIGAFMATKKAASGMTAGTHGSTFGGNPLAMAAANAVLDVMLAPGFFENVQKMGESLTALLDQMVAKFPALLEERRGKGLLLGLKCRIPNSDIQNALFQHGLLTVGAGGNVVRFLPPLTITDDDIAEAGRIMEQSFSELAV